MSLYYFCTDIRDTDSGLVVINDYETEVDVSVDLSSGIPEYSVNAVLVGGQDLLRSRSTFTRMLALMIVEDAEASVWLQEKINEREGIVYRGLGGNDPDGHFRRVA